MKYAGIKCEKCGREAPNCRCHPINPTWAGYPIQLQKAWHGEYLAKRTPKTKTFDKETRHKIIDLLRRGYHQSSRKYMQLNRYEDWYNRGTEVTLTEQEFACYRRAHRTIVHYRIIKHNV